MLRVVVLGAAAGGGVPQWNCGCPVCRAARSEYPELQSTQASIALSADGEHWFLINASPDLRQQLIATPQLHPRLGKLRHSPISGVILTNGEIDAVAGLLSMREGSPFTIYAHAKVLAILGDNSIFNVLSEKNVRRQPIEIDRTFEPALPDGSPSGIEVLPFAVAGKGAWYLEGKVHPAGNGGAGDTLGLRIGDKATGKYFYFLAACAEVTDDLKSRLVGAPLIFFDRLAFYILRVQHIEDAVIPQDRKYFCVCVDREGGSLAHRQQAGHRVHFAVGQDHACDRRMAQRTCLRMQLRRGIQLLAEVGGGVDQKPVLAVASEGDRGLGPLQLLAVFTGRPAALAAAIPLRHSAAGCGAQDDDAKHDPSPGDSKAFMFKASKADTGVLTIPRSGTCHARRSTCVNVKLWQPLICGRRTHTC